MCPPATFPLAEIGFDCTDEEVFMSLEKMRSGSPIPSNVLSDVDPYNYEPSNLPAQCWYLTDSKENRNTNFGLWKVRGEPCMLFSNSDINGWRTTLQFFEGQVPQNKTDWVMQVYWITHMGLGANSKLKEDRSLCRVFLGGEQGLDCEEEHKMSTPCRITRETHIHNNASNGSPSKPEIQVDKDDGTGKLAVRGRIQDYLVENPHEIDYLSRGDYLELDDLDNPVSPSSSSENSSCFSMSSDEYFDPAALLRELESEISQDSVLESEISQDSVYRNGNCKLSVSVPRRPDEVVMLPASPGIEGTKHPAAEESLQTDSSKPGSSHSSNIKAMDDNASQYAVGSMKSNSRDEGSSSDSHDGSTASGSNVEKKGACGRKRKAKNKYLCFMPYFLF